MRQQLLREAQEALANALRGLECTRMIRQDDPGLSSLKEDIRRIVQSETFAESELSTAD